MNEKKYSWRFPVPRGRFHWKDILIFHTYACALAIWPWIIHAILFPVQGAPQGFMMILTLPIAILATFIYTLVTAWKNRNMRIGEKLTLTAIAVFIPMSIFIAPLISRLIMNGYEAAYFLLLITQAMALPLLFIVFPSLFIGLGFMFVLPLFGICRNN